MDTLSPRLVEHYESRRRGGGACMVRGVAGRGGC
jgi:hypothetical protein